MFCMQASLECWRYLPAQALALIVFLWTSGPPGINKIKNKKKCKERRLGKNDPRNTKIRTIKTKHKIVCNYIKFHVSSLSCQPLCIQHLKGHTVKIIKCHLIFSKQFQKASSSSGGQSVCQKGQGALVPIILAYLPVYSLFYNYLTAAPTFVPVYKIY